MSLSQLGCCSAYCAKCKVLAANVTGYLWPLRDRRSGSPRLPNKLLRVCARDGMENAPYGFTDDL